MVVFLEFLVKYRLSLLSLILGVCLGIWGCNLLRGGRSDNTSLVGSSQTQSSSTLDTVKHAQSHSITTVTKPDGTKSVTVTESSSNEKDKSKEKVQSVTKVSERALSKYSVDITTDPFDYKNARAGVGARIGESPFFGVIEHEFRDHTTRVGVRMEW